MAEPIFVQIQERGGGDAQALSTASDAELGEKCSDEAYRGIQVLTTVLQDKDSSAAGTPEWGRNAAEIRQLVPD